jgi:OmpA-OmpF porin, OOP family
MEEFMRDFIRCQKRTRHIGRRLGATTVAMASALLMMQSVAAAQDVRVFEYAPSLETLRSILVPESRVGAARKIIIPRYDTLDSGKPVQPAAMPGAKQEIGSPPAAAPMQDASVERPPSAKPPAAADPGSAQPKDDQDAIAGIVGFRINFALNSAEVPESAYPFLDRMAQLMRQEPKLALVIEGHTDAYGGVQYNLQLSELRARAVGLALIQRGVAGTRLAVIGKGKSEPLSPNGYDPQNRRVQFVRAGGAR